jgi:alcohol dehydrogenase
MPYSFSTAARILGGRDTAGSVGELVKQAGGKRATIVTDPVVLGAGLVARVVDSLRASGVEAATVAAVVPEPTVANAEDVRARVRETAPDWIVGVGGGSCLDSAKVCSVGLTNPEPVASFLGVDRIGRAGIPTVLVPTTAGTGSEVTPNAILTVPEEQKKIGAVSRHLHAAYAVLDPALTISLPPDLTASTGMDAFIHCLESFWSRKANPVADGFCLEGMRVILPWIRRAVSDGRTDLEARERMLIGSAFGGMSLTGSSTAAVHALAYPIGGRYGVPHGVANSMLLLPVLEFTRPACEGRLALVAEVLGIASPADTEGRKVSRLLDSLAHLVRDLGIPTSLRRWGCEDAHVHDLAVAASGITRLLDNNPRPVTVPDIEALYRRLLP